MNPNQLSAMGTAFEWHVRGLRAQGLLLGKLERPYGSDPSLAFWSPVTHVRAETRAAGHPVPHWSASKQEIKHYPGHAGDYLYFGVPMRGDFEVQCELSIHNWTKGDLAYGGLKPSLFHDMKKLELHRFRRKLRDVTLDPPMKVEGGWFKYRLTAKDGQLTAFINDRKVYEERLPQEPDPWLALHVSAAHTGGARNLKIIGEPAIPESLNLSGHVDLSSWLADYYGETIAWSSFGELLPNRGRPAQTPLGAWTKRGDEITGRRETDMPGSKQESLLQYHRPMLEDGEIEYEFFYDPGKAMTHPALGRLAFLLDPDGVKIHWLTNGAHEREGLLPDNTTLEPANRRGPAKLDLKAPGWNRLKLVLVGDRVTLHLNDVEIYQRDLEATNQRILGLFHYADETEVRVRNVVYRGKWPKQLPADLLSKRP
jgi:hypothetical protein